MTERILAFSFNSETFQMKKPKKSKTVHYWIYDFPVILITLNIYSTILLDLLYSVSAKIVNNKEKVK